MRTLLILPASSDVASQCWIVAKYGDIPGALRDYRRNDGEGWDQVGRMSSRGELVCLDATPEVCAALRLCEPLAAAQEFYEPDLLKVTP